MDWLFSFRIEKNAVAFVRGQGKRQRDELVKVDGTVIVDEKRGASTTTRSGSWKNGVLTYQIKSVNDETKKVTLLIKREFSATKEGLKVRVLFGSPPTSEQVALYKHKEDIPMATPAKAKIADVAWIAGDWTGTRRTSAIEERWSPALGGAMLGTSRTVRRGKMIMFEFLRIVEHDGGLVYVAQPRGNPKTEFVLTKIDGKSAVFQNTRHDFPQRIIYTLSPEGDLTTGIGFTNGGTPRKFEYKREVK